MANANKPRWYRLTPDRVVVALLAVECLLLLSERFGWFAFSRHKGWAMLICFATVGAAFVLMFLWFLVAVLFRLRFQFSIRRCCYLLWSSPRRAVGWRPRSSRRGDSGRPWKRLRS